MKGEIIMGNKRAGIIIRKYGTNLILLEQGWGKSLPGTIYDIPKGHCEDGELLEDAAIREAKEEAGITVEQNELTFLGEFPYSKGDTLALFYCEKDFNLEDCKCSSYFENQYGKEVPEVIAYKLYDFVNDELEDSHIYKSLRGILERVFMVIQRY